MLIATDRMHSFYWLVAQNGAGMRWEVRRDPFQFLDHVVGSIYADGVAREEFDITIDGDPHALERRLLLVLRNVLDDCAAGMVVGCA